MHLVVPSDHLIENKSKFNNHTKKSLPKFFSEILFMFLGKVKRPSTSFGYIKLGKKNNYL